MPALQAEAVLFQNPFRKLKANGLEGIDYLTELQLADNAHQHSGIVQRYFDEFSQKLCHVMDGHRAQPHLLLEQRRWLKPGRLFHKGGG